MSIQRQTLWIVEKQCISPYGEEARETRVYALSHVVRGMFGIMLEHSKIHAWASTSHRQEFADRLRAEGHNIIFVNDAKANRQEKKKKDAVDRMRSALAGMTQQERQQIIFALQQQENSDAQEG